jgi:hypothetical protein
VKGRKLVDWKIDGSDHGHPDPASYAPDEMPRVALLRSFEFRLPLSCLLASPAAGAIEKIAITSKAAVVAATSRIKLRFSLWDNRLPVDALPVEGWIELELLSEAEMGSGM